MNAFISIRQTGARTRRFASAHGKSLAIVACGFALSMSYASDVFAQAASPAGGLGAQANLISSEATNASSLGLAMACYIGAALAFFGGVWSAWQSRQPQNRDGGYISRAVAGLVLCGVFATAGTWINKASVSASGGNATISTTPGMVAFTAGG